MIRFLTIIVFLVLYFILTIPFVLIFMIIGCFNKHARDVISLKFVQVGFKIVLLISGVKLDIYGKENVPEDTAVLYIGNHNSFFDVVTAYSVVPDLTGFIAKKEFKKFPGLNWWMYLVNCLFLDRTDARAGLETILEAVDFIRSGISIFVFPEGTRSRTGEMSEFKDGTFKIATKTDCPVIPVAFTGTANTFENQFPRVKPSRITITFGEPIYTGNLSKEEKKQLGNITKSRIQYLLDNPVHANHY